MLALRLAVQICHQRGRRTSPRLLRLCLLLLVSATAREVPGKGRSCGVAVEELLGEKLALLLQVLRLLHPSLLHVWPRPHRLQLLWPRQPQPQPQPQPLQPLLLG